jgi:hypothetical protein
MFVHGSVGQALKLIIYVSLVYRKLIGVIHSLLVSSSISSPFQENSSPLAQ